MAPEETNPTVVVLNILHQTPGVFVEHLDIALRNWLADLTEHASYGHELSKELLRKIGPPQDVDTLGLAYRILRVQ